MKSFAFHLSRLALYHTEPLNKFVPAFVTMLIVPPELRPCSA